MGSERRSWTWDTRHSWCDMGRPKPDGDYRQQRSRVTDGGQRCRKECWLSVANSKGAGMPRGERAGEVGTKGVAELKVKGLTKKSGEVIRHRKHLQEAELNFHIKCM